MNLETVKLFFKLYRRPAAAMSGMLDHGGWLVSAIGVLVVSFLFQSGVTNRVYTAYEFVPVPVPRKDSGPMVFRRMNLILTTVRSIR